MEALKRFEVICRAMTDPAFYPHPVSRIKRRDTHISAVFLTGPWAYKLKKPMDFGFLDFSKLEARRHFCRQEVRLNQRLSHGIYQGVVEIREAESGRYSLEGAGATVEYAVKMRQLPDTATLRSLLDADKITADAMHRLGYCLAAFYEGSERSPEIDHYGDPEVIAFNMEENFQQIEPFVGEMVEPERWEFIRQVSRAFFHNWRSLFEHRVQTGRIRDGHGDLRSEHIYFDDGIQIIDCIEFNDRFRYGDVTVDLAFLHMDMEYLGYPDFSQEVLTAYAEGAKDPAIYALIDFYAAYRAVVKLKVACLRSTEVSDEERGPLRDKAGEYQDLAYRYALQFSRPTLWAFCGLPATGKSLLAGRLGEALSVAIEQSDRIRKEGGWVLPHPAGVVPYGEGAYRAEMRQRVYARMLALAQEQLKSGHSVILDASFSRRKWRDEVGQLATDLDTNCIFVECICSEAAMRSRLKQRCDAATLSDARLQHLSQMIEDFEPLTEVSGDTHLRLDTERSPESAFSQLLAQGYGRKREQVLKLL